MDLSSVLCSSHLDLAGELTFVIALESGQGILPRRIVGRHDEHLLEALRLRIGTYGLVEIVVLIGDVEIVRIAVRTGRRRRSRIRRKIVASLPCAARTAERRVGKRCAGEGK